MRKRLFVIATIAVTTLPVSADTTSPFRYENGSDVRFAFDGCVGQKGFRVFTTGSTVGRFLGSGRQNSLIRNEKFSVYGTTFEVDGTFRDTSLAAALMSSGDTFGVRIFPDNDDFSMNRGYVYGSAISGSATFPDETPAGIRATAGTHVTGVGVKTITRCLGQASAPIPLPRSCCSAPWAARSRCAGAAPRNGPAAGNEVSRGSSPGKTTHAVLSYPGRNGSRPPSLTSCNRRRRRRHDPPEPRR